MEHVGYLKDEVLDAHMKAQGLFYYREYFPWGKTPAFRNDAKTVYRFFDHGDILTPTELLQILLDTWRPAGLDEATYAAYRMRHDLESLGE